DYDATPDGGYTWGTILQPYYNSHGLLHCPSDKTARPWQMYWGSGVYPTDDFPVQRHERSYAINSAVSWMGPSPDDEDFWPGWVGKTTEPTDPYETILLGEMWWSCYWGMNPMPCQYGAYVGCGFMNWRGPNFFGTIDVHRDNDLANYLFCDGHVDSISADDENVQIDGDYWEVN
ncbi:MAG: hypothetical protein KAV00_05560, partial [Phycisphaerae bacterium]|nr:hypothetical protein [Phycisphaerae bacterium]